MSVLVSKRKLSGYEYVHTFKKLYKYSCDRLAKVPRRKYQWLAVPIIEILNEVFNLILESANDFFFYGIKLLERKEQGELIISKLLGLQKPLIALWNIEQYDTHKMSVWADMINLEIKYISKLLCKGGDSVKNIFIIDYESSKKVKFVSNMRQLHRDIYSKTISLPYNIRNTNGLLLMQLADEALYRVFKANRHIPTTKEMVNERYEDLSTALECLKKMECPIMSVFSFMNYSESVLEKMSSELCEEIKLIQGVIKSDRERFKDIR